MNHRLNRNDPCWCNSNKKYKSCHYDFDFKLEKFDLQGHIVPSRDLIKNTEQINGIRESGKVNIAILDMIANSIRAGITTEDINQLVMDRTKELGGIPAQLGYEGFPKSVCTSVNDEVCHGIPSKDRILKEGDIINVDVSTIYKGYYSDSSRMFSIGTISEDKKRLIKVVEECVQLGLEQVMPWRFLGDVGQAVHDHALDHGYTVVREIGGHGIGLEFHEEPWVSYVTMKNTEMLMVPGMVFTIEPMVNMGTDNIYLDEENGWTYYTSDGKVSAQSEIMVLVTEEGHEVLAY